jgi:hypothetical protein
LRPYFTESDLLRHLKEHPALIEEWLLYSDDKRTDGGWYLSRDGTIGQVSRPGEEIRFPSLEEAVAAYVVRELDFWEKLSHGVSDGFGLVLAKLFWGLSYLANRLR